MSSIESAPTTTPATSETTLATGLGPARGPDPYVLADQVVQTGPPGQGQHRASPPTDTRSGSSESAETT